MFEVHDGYGPYLHLLNVLYVNFLCSYLLVVIEMHCSVIDNFETGLNMALLST